MVITKAFTMKTTFLLRIRTTSDRCGTGRRRPHVHWFRDQKIKVRSKLITLAKY